MTIQALVRQVLNVAVVHRVAATNATMALWILEMEVMLYAVSTRHAGPEVSTRMIRTRTKVGCA